MRRSCPKRFRAGPAIAGIALSFVALECVLHAIELTPAWRVLPVVEREPGWPDTNTGYALRPAQAIINVREHRARVSTNALGMRDRERAIAKPAATFRVAVTGDSFTEALQVADGKTFTRRAERLLNTGEARRHFEVLNFGMSGAGPVQQFVRARIAAATFSPDALVMFVNVNQLRPDLMRDDSVAPAFVRTADGSFVLAYGFRERRSQRMRDGLAGRVFFALMDHSRIARAAYLAVLHRGAAAAPAVSADVSLPVCEHLAARLRRIKRYWQADNGDTVSLAWLRAVEELAVAHGMPVALVLMGLGPPRDDCAGAGTARGELLETIRGHLAVRGFGVHDGDAEAARIARGEGITEPLTGFGRRRGSGHLNDQGHHVYARMLGAIIGRFPHPPPREAPPATH